MLNLSSYNLSSIEEKIFFYFSEISNIPRGSGNMKSIADYCENFAEKFNLKYIRDNANNIVIFKNGTCGGEHAEPIILQGHLDIVCQATEDCKIDFLNDGLQIYRDGDFIKAQGTTLGADNGIAIAYIMAILASSNVKHPPIEAVFTTDEEIGLLGAGALDCADLKAKKMINLDSETDDVVTVSCAGGQDVTLKLPITKTVVNGYKLTINIKGLLGGHSGVEIDKGRTNANILMGKILDSLNQKCEYSLISINGGKKTNAIPDSCTAEILTNDKKAVFKSLTEDEQLYFIDIQKTEPDFKIEVYESEKSQYTCFDNTTKESIIGLLQNVPDGVIKMSDDIEGLVETSLNLGILSTDNDVVTSQYALRSNKQASLHDLTNKVLSLGEKYNCETKASGFYPPWEYNQNSSLRELYKKCYKELFSKEIKVEAIHAGLECGVFANKIGGLDCISVGPNLFDVHTPKEKLDIASAIKTFNLILKVLSEICNL